MLMKSELSLSTSQTLYGSTSGPAFSHMQKTNCWMKRGGPVSTLQKLAGTETEAAALLTHTPR